MKRLLPLAFAALAVAVSSAAAARPLSPAKAFLNSITFPDSTQEDPLAPDITTVVVSNDDSKQITFTINVSNRPQFTPDMQSEIYLDTDLNSATGDPHAFAQGTDYLILLVPGQGVGMLMWDPTRNDYINAPFQSTLISAYPSTGPVIKVNGSDIGNPTAFNFVVDVISGITRDASGTPDFTSAHPDFAPDLGHGTWHFPIKVSPPPPPVPKKLSARVGPGAVISVNTAAGAGVRSLKAGSVVLTVHDLSSKDDFHLTGPGVNRRTSVAGKGTVVWTLKLAVGVYRYHSDAHPALKGTFTVTPA
jgi:hypothetical protein